MWRSILVALAILILPSLATILIVPDMRHAAAQALNFRTGDPRAGYDSILGVRLYDIFGQNAAHIDSGGEIWVRQRNVGGFGGGATKSCGTVSALILGYQDDRQFLAVDNESATQSIAISFGSTAAVLNTAGSWTIPAGMTRTWLGPYVPSDKVNCVAGANATPVTIQVK